MNLLAAALDFGKFAIASGLKFTISATARESILPGVPPSSSTTASPPALRAARARKPNKLVLAVPVAPTDTLAAMRAEADDVICLEDHEFFGAIGLFYSDFRQVSDQEVIDALARFPDCTTGRAAGSAV